MAKSQKRSTREPRKPKQAKPKPPSGSRAPPHSLLAGLDRPAGVSAAGRKGARS